MEVWLVSPRGRRGSVTETTAGMMEGLLDFCKNKNPINKTLANDINVGIIAQTKKITTNMTCSTSFINSTSSY